MPPKNSTYKEHLNQLSESLKAAEALTFEDLSVEPFRCPNCASSVVFKNEDRKLFCTKLCQAEADAVRYVRRRRAEGRDRDPDIAETIRIKLGLVLVGGYKKRQPPEAVREQVKKRDQEQCQACGLPGEGIDHISGDSNALENLQFLCAACHRKKTLAGFRSITKASHPKECAKADLLRKRWEAFSPRLLCDRPDEWKEIELLLTKARVAAVSRQRSLFR